MLFLMCFVQHFYHNRNYQNIQPNNHKSDKNVQCVQKLWSDCLNLVVKIAFPAILGGNFGRFLKIDFLADNFTPKTSKMTEIRSRTRIFKRAVRALFRLWTFQTAFLLRRGFSENFVSSVYFRKIFIGYFFVNLLKT